MKDKFINALTLNERIQVNSDLNDEKLLIETLRNWRSIKNILSNKQFDKMLKAMNISMLDFAKGISCISDKSKATKILEESKWFCTFKESLNLTEDIDVNKYKSEINMFYYIRNFIGLVESRLQYELTVRRSVADKVLINKLCDQYAQTTLFIFQKTFIYELNVARNNRELKGNSSEERFHFFCKLSLKKDKLISIYEKYPVLARLLSVSAINFINNITEFFDRFFLYKSELSELLNCTCDFSVSNITVGKGDTHQNGKCVYEVELSNGACLMYKPKDLRIVPVYNKIITWLNTKDLLYMDNISGLYFEDFAFEVKINPYSCTTKSQVSSYYERFGQLLGIMYILKANDLHMENLFACGEQPIIVDLETLFQQSIFETNPNQITAHELLSMEIADSILSTGLIPAKMTDLNIDLSGLSGDEVELDRKMEKIVDIGLDTMKIEEETVRLSPADNIVKLHEKKSDYKLYNDAIMNGFNAVVKVVISNRDKFIQLISKFSGKNVRLLIRNTQNYFRLLDISYHPSSLMNWLDRENIMQNLFNHIIDNAYVNYSEYLDMLKGDIPVFFQNISKTSIYDSRGISIDNFFKISSYNKVCNNIFKLDNVDLQRAIIKVKTGKYVTINKRHYDTKLVNDILQSSKYIYKEKFLQEAIHIGNLIAKNLVIKNDTCSFYTFTYADDLDIQPVDSSLYNGLSGIAIFYYYLYKVSNIPKFKKILSVIVNTLESSIYGNEDMSLITGSNAKLVLYYHLLRDKYDGQLEAKINNIIRNIYENTESFMSYDWIGGISSCISIICDLYNQLKNPLYLECILKLEERMRTIIDNKGEPIIGGFSHGYSSLALVYAKLGYFLNITRFTQKGLEYLAKDNNLFDKESGAWLDMRHKEKTFLCHWCHGAVGIGGSRYFMKKYVHDDNLLNKDISHALSFLRNSFFTNDDTLCHGNFGKTELLLLLSSDDKHYLDEARKLALYLLDIRHGSFLYDHTNNVFNYGLFMGASGIGYQLLRLYDNINVPSILFLE